MKVKMKMKKTSYKYDVNRPRSTDGQKFSKYIKCLSMMMFLCSKHHLSSILSSIYEKVKQQEKALLI